MIPVGYTSKTGWSDTVRCRAIGNGWHLGVATFMILTTLSSGLVDLPDMSTERPRIQPDPDGPTALDRAATWFLQSRTHWGPPTNDTQAHCNDSEQTWSDHWSQAASTGHPGFRILPLDPSHEYALWITSHFGSQIGRWRSQLLEDLMDIIETQQHDTDLWFSSRPHHVQKAYRQNWPVMTDRSEVPLPPEFTELQFQRPAFVNIPAMTTLLDKVEFERLSQFKQDCDLGFDLIGDLPPGTGWKQRHDNKYTDPLELSQFQTANAEYIQDGLQSRSAGPHSSGMLLEVLSEVDMGRIEGPFEAPSHWKTRTVGVRSRPDLRLLPCPSNNPLASVVFPIIQVGSDGKDKVRRGEDWRRSKHNSTVRASDQPHHHNIDSYVNAGRRAKQMFPMSDIHLWGHDHEGAYRQLPCRQPEHAYMILWTEDGPTLWRHNVLLFGAVGSVWGYNRFGDALMNICRSLFGAPVIHYVDDFGSAEPDFSAPSSFWTFSFVNQPFTRTPRQAL